MPDDKFTGDRLIDEYGSTTNLMEDGRQKTEDRKQKTEDRKQKTVVVKNLRTSDSRLQPSFPLQKW